MTLSALFDEHAHLNYTLSLSLPSTTFGSLPFELVMDNQWEVYVGYILLAFLD